MEALESEGQEAGEMEEWIEGEAQTNQSLRRGPVGLGVMVIGWGHNEDTSLQQ